MAVMGWKGRTPGVSIDSDVFTTIETIRIREGANVIWAEVNATLGAFDGFRVQYKAASDANFFTIADSTSDFTTAIQRPLTGVTTDMTSLAKGSAGTVWSEVKGTYEVRYQATSAAASDTVAGIKWQVR